MQQHKKALLGAACMLAAAMILFSPLDELSIVIIVLLFALIISLLPRQNEGEGQE